jgi:hypothetical protein
MPTPSPGTTITRYELSMPFTEFDLAMNRKKFIGQKVFTPRSVAIQSADVGRLKLEQLLSDRATKRAAGAGYGRDDFELDKYSYSTDEYGREAVMDDRQVAMYRDILDAESVYSGRAINAVLQEYERDCAAALYNTSTFTGSMTSALTTHWSDHENASPIDDLLALKEQFVLNCGLDANALVINALQWEHLKNCAEVVDRVKYTAKATQEEMAAATAAVLGLDEILVAGGLRNSANQAQTRAISRIWSNLYSALIHKANDEDPQTPCIGRTFMWSGDGPGAVGTDEELAIITEEYRDESVRGTVFRARNDREILPMYPQAGLLITNVLAS